ncbi:MAG: GNAT family N-acetyltransferase [Pyrinomonadaceae bacterium]
MGDICLRVPTDEDDDFLFGVYSTTRREEVAAFGWDEAQQIAFLRMQFSMRQRSYKMQFPDAEHSIILYDAARAGQMIIDRQPRSIRLTDIAVLPEYRRLGIAAYLIRQLQAEAKGSDKPLVLSVDKSNVLAKDIYEKNKFVVTAETQLLYEMEWRDRS